MTRPALARVLPDPIREPTITVRRATVCADVGLRTGFDAVARGLWPSIRVGRRILIPTQRWLVAVGLADAPAATTVEPAGSISPPP